MLEIHDIGAVKLYAHVYESVIGPDNFMGEAMWDTAAIVSMMGQAGTPTEPQELPLTRCTQPSKVGKERFQQEKTGTIRVSVGFVFPQLALGTLQVKVVSGSGLLAADTGTKGREDSSDPFAIVSTHQMHDGKPAEQKFVTQTIMQTLDPAWNETFFFDIWDLDAVLYLDIYDSDVDQDDYLGQGKLMLRDTAQTQPHAQPHSGAHALSKARAASVQRRQGCNRDCAAVYLCGRSFTPRAQSGLDAKSMSLSPQKALVSSRRCSSRSIR